MEIGKLVKARRESLGISRKQLGEMVNVKPAMISHIENGRRKVSAKRAAAFESALGIPKTELVPEIFGEAA